ncbi:uncharacterized protein PHACADRAFT_259635 [Phanerochaete carnosa HHB-10118-sp]|uniref:Uncharacterized protein n=1 Tax=Phanerochaete carnosa (strain HHB-10118-sp) TaxID=650164 RepID=K5WSH9_PHACS|nr:uncharacterized protein PHACADRAFT_259635 [Phanerochaete carnosa HHB-10118-sp]EKM53337.1 hypothetical protein PHACADRAFT_259635 [Phanerochaete carnosa HHB-10118-sp]
MVRYFAFGYKVKYQWIFDRANELYMVPWNDTTDARANVMFDYFVTVVGQAGLMSYVRPIALKDEDCVGYCLASTDPSDGLPSRARDAEKIEKLRQIVG